MILLNTIHANGTTKQVPVTGNSRFTTTPDARYELIDSNTGKPPKDLAIRRDGRKLILESTTESTTVEIMDYYPEEITAAQSSNLGNTGLGDPSTPSLGGEVPPVQAATGIPSVAALPATTALSTTTLIGIAAGGLGLAAAGGGGGGGGGGSSGTPPTQNNNLPSGSVTITGIAAQGQLLTASNTLADLDGVGPITYTWKDNTGATLAACRTNAAQMG